MWLNRIRGGIIALIPVLVLAACATAAKSTSMQAPEVKLERQYAYSVSVKVSGGQETGAMDTTNISNSEFKAAIEESIRKSGLFKSVVPSGGEGDYRLTVMVAKVDKPAIGFTFTVNMDAGWTLVRSSDRAVVMRQLIRSSNTATTGDAFVGASRLQMAVEGAAQNNIELGLRALSQLDL